MTRKKQTIITITFFFFLLLSCIASSNENITIRHQLVASVDTGKNSVITLSLRVKNDSDTNFTNVKLVPVGNTFSVSEKSKMLHIGYLPSQGESVVQWVANTSMATNYFKVGMPILFHMVVDKGVKKTFRLPIISQGE